MTSFADLPIKAKFLALVLAITLPTIGLIGWLGYKWGQEDLEATIFGKLTAIRAAKASQIESYFLVTRYQAKTLSENRMIVDAMEEFKSAFHELAQEPDKAGDDRQQWVKTVREFYASEFLPRLRATSDDSRPLDAFVPSDLETLRLQYHYLVQNPNPVGKKDALNHSEAGTAYDTVHAKYHPLFRNFQKRFGYYDLFLVDDQTGHIVYSVFKETDFATSLLSGAYRESNLALAFRNARLASDSDAVKLVDFASYAPSYGAPAAFIASPIFDAGKRTGVLVFQLPVDEINRVMTGGGNWRAEGLGETGETYLVGADYKMRSVSRFLIQQPEEYFAALAKINVLPAVIQRIRTFGTSILLQEVRTRASDEALHGQAKAAVIADYRGIPVVSSYAPLGISDVRWAILSEMHVAEAFAPVTALRQRILILAGLITVGVLIIALLFARVFTRPIHDLIRGTRAMAGGNLDVNVKPGGKDEIGELASTFNDMVACIRDKTRLLEQRNVENEHLLLNILPGPIATRIKGGEERIADGFQEVSVLFADLVDFTKMSASMSPEDLVDLLNDLFCKFDELMLRRGVEKIKTIGDCYMAVCGLPAPDNRHAQIMAEVALEILEVLEQFNQEHGTSLRIRIGLNCGPVVAGVIGTSKYIYDLWGDTVNMASRMESNSLPNQVQVTAAMYHALQHDFEFESRGLIEIKGKGMLPAYLLKKREPIDASALTDPNQ
jgi:class 3 adenylate cyclase